MFDLPTHIPTPALIYSFGLIYTSLRIEQKQLLYLWKVMNRDEQHWTHSALQEVMTMNIGWGKTIRETLTKYNLPTQLDIIKAHGKGEWTNNVKRVIEKRNTERLIQDCYKIENDQNKRKTKTSHIVDQIEDPTYQRTPLKELLKCTKRETKTIMLGRYSMLECGKNFKGSRSVNCGDCDLYDDEKHRINDCIKFRTVNNFDSDTKVDFNLIFSRDIVTLREIIPKIAEVWNIRNANGTMNVE